MVIPEHKVHAVMPFSGTRISMVLFTPDIPSTEQSAQSLHMLGFPSLEQPPAVAVPPPARTCFRVRFGECTTLVCPPAGASIFTLLGLVCDQFAINAEAHGLIYSTGEGTNMRAPVDTLDATRTFRVIPRDKTGGYKFSCY